MSSKHSAMQFPSVSKQQRTLSGINNLINSLYFRNNYATFKQIRSDTITMKEDQSKKAKLFITLERHADFEKNIALFEEIRAENDKKAGIVRPESTPGSKPPGK